MVLSKRSDNSECRKKENEPKSEREKEPKRHFFLFETRNKSVNDFFPETIDDEGQSSRKQKISEYLEKEDESAVRTSREVEIDETENEEMKEGIEDDRERGEGHFVFLGTQSKEFVGRVDESKGNEIRTISRSGFNVKTYAIILREDKNGENNETENFEEICGHNKRVND